MADGPALTADQRAVIDEFQTTLKTHIATAMTKSAEENQATLKKLEELGAKSAEIAKEQGERIEKLEGDMRVAKQRGLIKLPGDAGFNMPDARSFGQQLAESKEWKEHSWAGRSRLQITLKTRLWTPPWEKKVITEAGSGFPVQWMRLPNTIAPPQMPLVMRDLVTVVPLGTTNAVEYVTEAWTNNANYQVAEGDRKPESNVTFTDATAVVRTIAHFVKISRQMAADVPYVMSVIDSRLVYGVMKKEEHEILYGDNAAGHLHGIMPQAPAIPADAIAGMTSKFDEIAGAIAYQSAAGYPPTAIVINPVTWAGMSIEKNINGNYLLPGPQTTSQPTLWGVPLVATSEMAANDYLIGQFPGNVALFDREAVTTDTATENEDDFVKNLITIRCEERVALAVYVPAAFGKGPFRLPVAAPPLGRSGEASKDRK